ncbi:MAG: transporter [Planctomycetota bacterium]
MNALARQLLVLAPFALAGCQLSQQAPVTPQRPTVSFDTATTAPGTFELETGVNVDPGDFFDTPNTLKYGTGERTELFVGWSPLQVLSQPGEDADGASDVVLGARHRLWDADDGTPSGAVVLSGKLPTASSNNGLGSGEVDLRVGGILNQSFGDVSANLFYQYGALGQASGGTTSEHIATLTLGTPLAEDVGGFFELGGQFVPTTDTDALFAITGVTWSYSPSLVFDGGVNVGLSDDAADLQVFFGCTWNLGGPPMRR